MTQQQERQLVQTAWDLIDASEFLPAELAAKSIWLARQIIASVDTQLEQEGNANV